MGAYWCQDVLRARGVDRSMPSLADSRRSNSVHAGLAMLAAVSPAACAPRHHRAATDGGRLSAHDGTFYALKRLTADSCFNGVRRLLPFSQ